MNEKYYNFMKELLEELQNEIDSIEIPETVSDEEFLSLFLKMKKIELQIKGTALASELGFKGSDYL